MVLVLCLSSCTIKLSTTNTLPTQFPDPEIPEEKAYEDMDISEKMEYKSVIELVAATDYSAELLAPALDKQTELWGYVNLQGEWIIAPEYKEAYPFDGDYAVVMDAYSDVMLIDRQGEVKYESYSNVPLKSIGKMSEEGILNVTLKSDISVSSAYINTQTEGGISMYWLPRMAGFWYATDAYVQLATPFKDGKAVVIRLLNESLKNSQYSDFKESAHIIDVDGNVLASLPAGLDVMESGFDENMMLIVKDTEDKYGLANAEGQVVVQPKYDYIDLREGNLYLAKRGDLYGFINNVGETVIDFSYTDARPFSENLAAVNYGSGWGFIDENREIVIPCLFDEVASMNGNAAFSSGVAVVRKGNYWGIIDATGEIIFAAEGYECPVAAVSNGYISYEYKDSYGVFTIDGKYVLLPQYSNLGRFE